MVGDATDKRGNWLWWKDWQQSSLHDALRAPYEKLLDNLDLSKGRSFSGPRRIRPMWCRVPSRTAPLSGDTILNFLSEMKESFESAGHLGDCKKTYTIYNEALISSKAGAPAAHVPLRRIIVGLPRTDVHQGIMLSFIVNFTDDIAITARFRWDDGK